MNKKQYPIPATIVIRLNGDELTLLHRAKGAEQA